MRRSIENLDTKSHIVLTFPILPFPQFRGLKRPRQVERATKMTNSVKTIVADLDFDTRHRVLGMFAPVHPYVYCHHVTAAYRDVNVRIVGLKEAVVTGHVVNDRVQVLLLRVDGDDYRPDGKLWHLTLSIAEGVPPKEGGDVTFDQATETDDFRFQCLFRTRAARRDDPELNYMSKEVLYAE